MKRQFVAILPLVSTLAFFGMLPAGLFADTELSARERLTAWRADNVRQCLERLKGGEWSEMPALDPRTDVRVLTTNLLSNIVPALSAGAMPTVHR